MHVSWGDRRGRTERVCGYQSKCLFCGKNAGNDVMLLHGTHWYAIYELKIHNFLSHSLVTRNTRANPINSKIIITGQ